MTSDQPPAVATRGAEGRPRAVATAPRTAAAGLLARLLARPVALPLAAAAVWAAWRYGRIAVESAYAQHDWVYLQASLSLRDFVFGTVSFEDVRLPARLLYALSLPWFGTEARAVDLVLLVANLGSAGVAAALCRSLGLPAPLAVFAALAGFQSSANWDALRFTGCQESQLGNLALLAATLAWVREPAPSLVARTALVALAFVTYPSAVGILPLVVACRAFRDGRAGVVAFLRSRPGAVLAGTFALALLLRIALHRAWSGAGAGSAHPFSVQTFWRNLSFLADWTATCLRSEHSLPAAIALGAWAWWRAPERMPLRASARLAALAAAWILIGFLPFYGAGFDLNLHYMRSVGQGAALVLAAAAAPALARGWGTAAERAAGGVIAAWLAFGAPDYDQLLGATRAIRADTGTIAAAVREAGRRPRGGLFVAVEAPGASALDAWSLMEVESRPEGRTSIMLLHLAPERTLQLAALPEARLESICLRPADAAVRCTASGLRPVAPCASADGVPPTLARALQDAGGETRDALAAVAAAWRAYHAGDGAALRAALEACGPAADAWPEAARPFRDAVRALPLEKALSCRAAEDCPAGDCVPAPGAPAGICTTAKAESPAAEAPR